MIFQVKMETIIGELLKKDITVTICDSAVQYVR